MQTYKIIKPYVNFVLKKESNLPKIQLNIYFTL